MNPEEKLQNRYFNLLARLIRKCLSLRRCANLKSHVNAIEDCSNCDRHTCFMRRRPFPMDSAASTSASRSFSSSLSSPPCYSSSLLSSKSKPLMILNLETQTKHLKCPIWYNTSQRKVVRHSKLLPISKDG
jgi:hypothetical protein